MSGSVIATLTGVVFVCNYMSLIFRCLISAVAIQQKNIRFYFLPQSLFILSLFYGKALNVFKIVV